MHILLRPDDKRPMGDTWQLSDNPDVVKEWYRKGNVGLVTGLPSGIVVRDFDGEEGLQLARSEFQGKYRDWFKCLVRTASGTIHQYLRQPDFHVSNAVKVNGTPVDLRGAGGYVVAVGSKIRGRIYEYVPGFEFRSVEELPVFLPEWLPRPKEINHEVIEETDVLRRITRARLWLATVEPAVSGQNGHKTMFRATVKMFQKFGLSISEAYPLILEYNDRCLPKFSEAEVRHKIDSAYAVTKGG